MFNLQTILDKLELSPNRVNGLISEARASALNCGNSKLSVELADNSWSILAEIFDNIWDADQPLERKYLVNFEAYESFPHYFHFLSPLYYRLRDFHDEPAYLKEMVWQKFMAYLGGEKYLCDPVGYVLWADYFEDQGTVAETWQGLLRYRESNVALRRLVENAGPVPFDLKLPLYERLLTDETNHQSIFKSLLFSAYDLFGQIDREEVARLLSRLAVDTDHEHYQKLIKKLELNAR